MADFKPKGVLSQSTDGKVITFTDTSGTPPNPVLSRRLTVTDGKSQVVRDIVMPEGSSSINFPITKDAYLSVLLTWAYEVGTPAVNTINYLSTRFYNIALLKFNPNSGCGCGGSKCDKSLRSYMLADTAETYFQLAMGSLSQDAIEAANSLLNSLVK